MESVEAIDQAKETKEVIGLTQTGHKVLGSSTTKLWSKVVGKEKIDIFIIEIRPNEDFRRVQKAVRQPQQPMPMDSLG